MFPTSKEAIDVAKMLATPTSIKSSDENFLKQEFMRYIKNEDLSMIEFFVENSLVVLHDDYVDENSEDDEKFLSAFHYAVEINCNSLICLYLLKNIKNIDVINCYQESYLHILSKKPFYLNCIKYILENEELVASEINHQDRWGQTALHVALKKSGNFEIVKYLLKKGADSTIHDDEGTNPFFIAIDTKNYDAIKLFVEMYPELIEDLNSDRKTPLEMFLLALKYNPS